MAIAHRLSFLDPYRLTEEPWTYWDEWKGESLRSEIRRFPCRQPDGTCAVLEFVDEILVRIDLYPNYELTFGEVVAHLGTPDYVQLFLYGPEAPPFCGVALIWEDRTIRVAFDLVDPWPRRGERRVRCSDVPGGTNIDPTLPVTSIMYGLPRDPVFAGLPESGGAFPWTGFAEP